MGGAETIRHRPQVAVVDVSHAAARVAHQMMMRHLLLDLEEAPRWAEAGLPYQMQIHQELKRAVHGGDVDMGELLLDLTADLLGAHVRTFPAEDVPYQSPLRGEAVPEFLQSLCGVMRHCYCEFIAIAHACQ